MARFDLKFLSLIAFFTLSQGHATAISTKANGKNFAGTITLKLSPSMTGNPKELARLDDEVNVFTKEIANNTLVTATVNDHDLSLSMAYTGSVPDLQRKPQTLKLKRSGDDLILVERSELLLSNAGTIVGTCTENLCHIIDTANSLVNATVRAAFVINEKSIIFNGSVMVGKLINTNDLEKTPGAFDFSIRLNEVKY